jgi:hypothetical protein
MYNIIFATLEQKDLSCLLFMRIFQSSALFFSSATAGGPQDLLHSLSLASVRNRSRIFFSLYIPCILCSFNVGGELSATAALIRAENLSSSSRNANLILVWKQHMQNQWAARRVEWETITIISMQQRQHLHSLCIICWPFREIFLVSWQHVGKGRSNKFAQQNSRNI